MRGFGNAEMLFATESMIDMAAGRLGIDPMEIRLKNCTQEGDITVHGWVINSCGLSQCIKRAAEEAGWKERRKNKEPNRGIGMACQVHVTGNRAVSPLYDGSAAFVKVDQYGKVKVISGESEIGQGLTTTLAQIAAEELGIGMENIEVMPVDTDYSQVHYMDFASQNSMATLYNSPSPCGRELEGEGIHPHLTSPFEGEELYKTSCGMRLATQTYTKANFA